MNDALLLVRSLSGVEMLANPGTKFLEKLASPKKDWCFLVVLGIGQSAMALVLSTDGDTPWAEY